MKLKHAHATLSSGLKLALPSEPVAKKKGRNPNQLPPETAERIKELLNQLYVAHEENGAAVGKVLGITGSAVSQILSGRTRQISITTAQKIAEAVGKTLHISISGEAPTDGVRTIGSDAASAAALAAARREFGIPTWIVALLARTPIPDNWPSLTPQVVLDLASVWEKWEGRLGSRVREKHTQNP